MAKKDVLLNATRAGWMLGIGSYGVLALAKRGVLPVERDQNNHRVYRQSDVKKLIAVRARRDATRRVTYAR